MEQSKRGAERISGVPNVTYDLVAVLHNKLDAIAAMEIYKQDAQGAGHREAEAFFDQCQRDDRAAVERLRGLLSSQLQAGMPGIGAQTGQTATTAH